jgi:hypothetical protein
VSFQREILDHGYLTVVEHWGSDERVIAEHFPRTIALFDEGTAA